MPLGSSSDAPVMSPGPSASSRRGLLCPTTGLGPAGKGFCDELIQLGPLNGDYSETNRCRTDYALAATRFHDDRFRVGEGKLLLLLAISAEPPSLHANPTRLPFDVSDPKSHFCYRPSDYDGLGGDGRWNPSAPCISRRSLVTILGPLGAAGAVIGLAGILRRR